MKKLMVLLLCLSLGLCGCGRQEAKTEAVPEKSIPESVEETAAVTDAAADRETQEPETAAVSEPSEAVETEMPQETVVKNSGYFVQYGEKVYYHIPDASGMEEAVLWQEYTSADHGDTLLLESDVTTGQTQILRYDHSWGTMGISGPLLLYQDYDYPNDIPVPCISGYQLTEEPVEIRDHYESFLAVDEKGSFAIGADYLSEDSAYMEKGWWIDPIKNGDTLAEIPLGDSFIYVGLADNLLIYRCYAEENDVQDGEWLKQVNLETGEILTLGRLPVFDYAYPQVDQTEVYEDVLHLTYSGYEGTGHFYSGCFHVTAVLNQEDSLEYETGESVSAEEEPLGPAVFRLNNGTCEIVEGIPGQAGISDEADGSIGYYDETGTFVQVTSGYGQQGDTENGPVTKIERAELVGNYIYAVRNISERVPEEDVGWRYAYRRLQTEIVRIDIQTGEEELLARQSADGLYMKES